MKWICKQVGKGEIKLPLFVDDILCIENPKDSTKKEKNKTPKLLELINLVKLQNTKYIKIFCISI